MIQAVVGAGGKTSFIKKMVAEYRKQGKKVFVCTTTHVYKEENCIVDGSAEQIISRLQSDGYVLAGSEAGEKIGILPDAVYQAVCAVADEVLVEADGAKHKAIKFPSETEPVIPDNADEIVVLCGLHALGRPLKEVAHRVELVKQCLHAEDETRITPEQIQTLLRCGYGQPLQNKYPDKKLRYVVAHDASLYQRALAALLEADMDVSLIREEWFAAPPRLFLCGGGHVSQALAQMTASLDYPTVVMDDRADYVTEQQFPTVDRRICDQFENLHQYIQPGDYFIVVTRGHKDDLTCVQQILKQHYAYLGMIGSKKKVQTAMERLKAEGFSQEQLATIHAPIGLPIHAVTPAEIAVSILAEIIQVKNQKQCSSVSRRLLSQQGAGVLCLIVDKQGSSPRGVGSMMLVTAEESIDSIGGGAVEFAAIEAARQEPNRAIIRSYQLNKKETNALDMVCGGSNQVLFLPLK